MKARPLSASWELSPSISSSFERRASVKLRYAVTPTKPPRVRSTSPASWIGRPGLVKSNRTDSSATNSEPAAIGPATVHSGYAAPATTAMNPAMPATASSAPPLPAALREAPARINRAAAAEKAIRMAKVARSERITAL